MRLQGLGSRAQAMCTISGWMESSGVILFVQQTGLTHMTL